VLTDFSFVQKALSALKRTRTFNGQFCSQSCDGEVTVEPEEVGNVKYCLKKQPGCSYDFWEMERRALGFSEYAIFGNSRCAAARRSELSWPFADPQRGWRG